jgi:nitric oxide reductase NorD protein
MAKRPSLLRRAYARRHDLRVTAGLLLQDRPAAVAYAQTMRSLDRLPDDAESYRAFIQRAAGRGIAREVALDLPEVLARLPAAHRAPMIAALEAALAQPEAVPLLIELLPALYQDMSHGLVQEFVAEGLALYPRNRPEAEAFLRRESGEAARRERALRPGVALDEIRSVLLHYARAHCGDAVEISVGARPEATATTIVLPDRVALGDKSFLWYRVQTALLAGEIEFGTHADPDRTARALSRMADPELGRSLFQVFEQHRVGVRVREAYPGIDRDLRLLPPDEPSDRTPADAVFDALRRRSRGQPVSRLLPALQATFDRMLPLLDRLGAPDATADDSLAAAAAAIHTLIRLRPDSAAPDPAPPPELPNTSSPAWEANLPAEGEPVDDDGPHLSAPRDAIDREARDAYDEMVAWLDREAPISGGRVERTRAAGDPTWPDASDDGPRRGAQYPEWDWQINDYRPGWVRVIDEPCPADDGGAAFAAATLDRHRALVRRLRRSFEALHPEKQPRPRASVDGDDIDTNALVERHVARRTGGAPPDRLYLRHRPDLRDVCSLFLVDLSSSTNEIANQAGQRILDVEKEALLCLAEALDALGDRFAVDGFSGYGRDHVAYFQAKSFDEPLGADVRAKIGGLRWRMENRDGAAIRHATRRLSRQPARTRLLWLLSDGRPLDCGCERYHDRYAQRDTHRALLEARRAGIHPFCLTVDPRGSDYLAEMYGDAYLVVERAEQLVEVLPRVYRRLAR